MSIFTTECNNYLSSKVNQCKTCANSKMLWWFQKKAAKKKTKPIIAYREVLLIFFSSEKICTFFPLLCFNLRCWLLFIAISVIHNRYILLFRFHPWSLTLGENFLLSVTFHIPGFCSLVLTADLSLFISWTTLMHKDWTCLYFTPNIIYQTKCNQTCLYFKLIMSEYISLTGCDCSPWLCDLFP